MTRSTPERRFGRVAALVLVLAAASPLEAETIDPASYLQRLERLHAALEAGLRPEVRRQAREILGHRIETSEGPIEVDRSLLVPWPTERTIEGRSTACAG